MTGLPDQENHGTTYSESDVQHIVARKLAAIQMEQLQNGQIELQKELRREIAEVKASVAELVNAWNSAGTLIRMVKYAAAFVAACIFIAGVIKGYQH